MRSLAETTKAIPGTLPVVLSALLIAARFFRSRSLPLLALSPALPLLLLVRKGWSARIVQAGLLLGAVAILTDLSALAVRVPQKAVPGDGPEAAA